jgi:hypothetical protein
MYTHYNNFWQYTHTFWPEEKTFFSFENTFHQMDNLFFTLRVFPTHWKMFSLLWEYSHSGIIWSGKDISCLKIILTV